MLKIELQNLTEVRAALTEFSDRRFNAAVATALTRTAVKVRDDQQRLLPVVFDRPTAYTTRQMRYVPATAQRLTAAVGFDIKAIQGAGNVVTFEKTYSDDMPAAKYLEANVEGGVRRNKRLEVALRALGVLPAGWLVVPAAGARLDGNGNVSSGQVKQMLAHLRISLASSGKVGGAARVSIGEQRKAGGSYFVMPLGKRTVPGVYQRELIGRNITPVFIFVQRAQYRARYEFDAVSRRLADVYLPIEAGKAIDESLARLRAKA